MTVGDRVETPHGPGRVLELGTRQLWAGWSTRPFGYAIVELDVEPELVAGERRLEGVNRRVRSYPATDVAPTTREETQP